MKIYGPTIPGVKLSPDLEKALQSSQKAQKSESDFGDLLLDKIQKTDELQKTADTAVSEFASGKGRNLHEAVLAMEMADTSLRLMVTVRNKVVEAYQEIMRMPV
jgi:flagellar hook-basal body complex protein FliE